jgi:hypothetical protein
MARDEAPTQSASVHRRGADVGWKTLLIFNLQQHKPTVIPAAHTRGITDHQALFATWLARSPHTGWGTVIHLGLVQQIGAEWIVLGESAQLIQQIVRVDVVSPGSRHWLSD